MKKGSVELKSARKKEIIEACKQLYQTVSFKNITLKEIAKVTTFTRTSIYNYFQTKEEIFLEILKNEYELWIIELQSIIDNHNQLSKEEYANKIAKSLENRELMLKLLSMNMYDIEEHSRMENLVEFKTIYGRSMNVMTISLAKFFNQSTNENRQIFIYQFFPFVYGIYPYTNVTDKQLQAMEKALVDYKQQTIYEITYNCLMQLLLALEN